MTMPDRRIPMKIGTMPCLVTVHGADRGRLSPGAWIRVREQERGPWTRILVDAVNADGYVFASR